jgi:hypothetical protein
MHLSARIEQDCCPGQATTTSPAGPAWTKLDPAASPPARGDASMAYDPATRTMLLFSGFSDQIGSAGYLDDTWSWNGTTWTQLFPAASPPARTGAPMAYDAATGTVLLFGGFGRISGDAYGGGYDTARHYAAATAARCPDCADETRISRTLDM